jgi:hypothetical protein
VHAVSVEVDGVRYPSARAADRALGLTYGMTRHRAYSEDYPTYRWLGATPGTRPVKTFEELAIAKALTEPERWPFDGDLSRRASVMDPNVEPPKLVRTVGYMRCMSCGRPHWSEDVIRARMCTECGGVGGFPIGSRSAAEEDI